MPAIHLSNNIANNMLNIDNDYTELTLKIKEQALLIGFDFCGIAKAEYLTEDSTRLNKWLDNGYHASLKYLENNFEKRINPKKLMGNAKSIICLASNYYFPYDRNVESLKISRYALGEDYHKVLKSKLKELSLFITSLIPEAKCKICVDSAPILEKTWAVKAGLGFIGKNNLFIIPNEGSYYFLSELIIDIELDYDNACELDLCGNCNQCLTACPSGALESPRNLNVSKCLSYLNKDTVNSMLDKFKNKTQNFIFGCDICQEICPINKRAKKTKTSEFYPSEELLEQIKNNFDDLNEENFHSTFKKSAINLLGYEKFMRNIEFCKKQ